MALLEFPTATINKVCLIIPRYERRSCEYQNTVIAIVFENTSGSFVEQAHFLGLRHVFRTYAPDVRTFSQAIIIYIYYCIGRMHSKPLGLSPSTLYSWTRLGSPKYYFHFHSIVAGQIVGQAVTEIIS